jgi:hypothetical protein
MFSIVLARNGSSVHKWQYEKANLTTFIRLAKENCSRPLVFGGTRRSIKEMLDIKLSVLLMMLFISVKF